MPPDPIEPAGPGDTDDRAVRSARWRRTALIGSAAAGIVLLTVLATLLAADMFSGDDRASEDRPEQDPAVPTFLELLTAGDCYEPGDAETVTAVDCDERHLGEVTARVDHPADAGDPAPADDELADWTDRRCRAEAEDYVESPSQMSGLVTFGVYPNEQAWDLGERTIVCAVESIAGSPLLVGSVHGGS